MKKLAMTAEAWLWLAIARAMLLVLPFRKLTPILGKKILPPSPATEVNNDRLKDIGKAILRAGKYSPWRTKCFEQALAAKMMLKCRGRVSTVFFGVKKSETLYAHAWLESAGFIVTGKNHLEQFTVIACYKS